MNKLNSKLVHVQMIVDIYEKQKLFFAFMISVFHLLAVVGYLQLLRPSPIAYSYTSIRRIFDRWALLTLHHADPNFLFIYIQLRKSLEFFVLY
jgi:hypothetical protein